MRMGIKQKIIARTMIVILIITLVSGMYTYFYFKDILQEQLIRDQTHKLQQIANQIQYIQEEIRQFSEYILIDDEIQTQIVRSYSEEDVYNKIYSENKVSRKLKNYISLRNYTKGAFLVMNDGNIISSDPQRNLTFYKNMISQSWYLNFMIRNVRVGFSEPFPSPTGPNKTNVSYITKFNLVSDGSMSGYLVILFDLAQIEKFIPADNFEYDGCTIIQAGGILLSSKGDCIVNRDSLWQANTDHVYFNKSDTITFINDQMEDGWQLVSTISLAKILQKIEYIFYFFAFLNAASLLVILSILTPVLLNFTKPIMQLTRAMKSASSGNLNIQVSIRSKDEMEILGNGFNRMITELQTYLHQSIEDEKIKQKLQIDLLNSQIGPHFIYNTLNTVIYMAQMRGNTDIVKMMESFIRILQDGIKEGKEKFYTTVSEEVANLNDYAVIQRYRYPDRFNLHWQVDETTRYVLIPRIILQPLVENAIFHGIIPKEQPGNITVRIQLLDKEIGIEVEDDGVGMDESTMVKIMNGEETLDSSTRMRPIGLANIRNRLLNHYGPEYNLSIESRIGQGTKVMLKIPLTLETQFVQKKEIA